MKKSLILSQPIWFTYYTSLNISETKWIKMIRRVDYGRFLTILLHSSSKHFCHIDCALLQHLVADVRVHIRRGLVVAVADDLHCDERVDSRFAKEYCISLYDFPYLDSISCFSESFFIAAESQTVYSTFVRIGKEKSYQK